MGILLTPEEQQDAFVNRLPTDPGTGCDAICRAQVRKIDDVVLGRLEAALSDDIIEACQNDTTHSGRIIHDAMTMRCQVREIRQTLHAAGEGK